MTHFSLTFYRITTIALLLTTLYSCKDKPPEVIPETNNIQYSFFVAGHTYGNPMVPSTGIYPTFVDKFNIINEDANQLFGFFTGDITRQGREEQWEYVDSDIVKINVPVNYIVGNHDSYHRDVFIERYGNTYSSFISNDDLFIILDPNLDDWNISGEQLSFLDSVVLVNKNSVDNIFVFFHQLLWWSPDNIFKNVKLNSTEGRDSVLNFWTDVEPIFNSISNNVVMFAGDLGALWGSSNYMYYKYDNITFVASGMGDGNGDNFIIVEVFEDKSINFRLIAINGNDINALGDLEEYELP